MLQIKLDARPLLDIAKDLGEFKDEAPKLMSGVIRQTLNKGRVQLKRATQEVLNLDTRSIDSRLRVKVRNRDKLPEGALEAKEELPPSLTSFGKVRDTTKRGGKVGGARQTRGSGVFVQVRKGAAIERHPRSFKAKGRGGAEQIFTRAAESGQLDGRGSIDAPRVDRYPLLAQKGPSPVGLLLGKPGFADEIVKDMGDTLEERADGAVRGFLDRKLKD